MLEDLLKFDKLGNKEELQFILFKALPLSESQKIDDLKKYCSSCIFTFGRSFNGILKLLEEISFINIENDCVALNKTLFDPLKFEIKSNYFQNPDFVSIILSYIKKENSINNIFTPDSIKYRELDNKFYLKENLIPYKYFPIRNLFLSLSVFERDELYKNHLSLNQLFNECFQNIVINDIQEKSKLNYKRKVTNEQLKNQLVSNEQLGLEAEIFVEKFEKKRLQGHFSSYKIRRISEEFVNAGYDIESFANNESIIIDKYIEVKSFRENVSFFWSKNEINIAKEFGDKYYLYLVDRNKINEDDYVPSIFQNPYKKIFENEYWIKEIQNWKITLE